MSEKNRSKLNWAALGFVLLALDGASLLGAHHTWVWLSQGGGDALLRSGQVVAARAYAMAEGHLADAASDLVLRTVEQTTGVYALMDSLTPASKPSSAHSTTCRVLKIRVPELRRMTHTSHLRLSAGK